VTRRQAAVRSSAVPLDALGSRRPPVWRTALTALMWLLLAAYVLGLAAHGHGFEPVVDGWLGELTQLLPAAVCWAAVPTSGPRRREVVCLAVAMSAFAVGNAMLVVAASQQAVLPFPSWADAAYLCFYPLALVAIVLAVHREHREHREHRTLRGALWLDSLLGGLAATAVLAVGLAPVFALASGSLLEVTVALAYPVFDLLLVGAVVGVAALQGRGTQRHWFPLLVGLLLLATADTVYALRVSYGSYVVGTPLDALWAVALALFSGWAAAMPPRGQVHEQPVGFVVPALASVAGLSVLVAASRTHLSLLAVGWRPSRWPPPRLVRSWPFVNCGAWPTCAARRRPMT